MRSGAERLADLPALTSAMTSPSGRRSATVWRLNVPHTSGLPAVASADWMVSPTALSAAQVVVRRARQGPKFLRDQNRVILRCSGASVRPRPAIGGP